MKVSFNQTYGNNRKILLQARLRDKKFIEFLSFFDINIFSFHNCSDEIINFFRDNKEIIPNVRIIINNDISYTQCIVRLLKIINELNARYFFFYQDDTFSYDNDDINFKSLLDYVFTENDIMLTFFEREEFFNNLRVLKQLDDIRVYDNHTVNYAASNKWSFDDSPYICTTNYLSNIYDQNYLSCPDIWAAEQYNNFKFKTNNIKRYVLNKSLFKNYNFIGHNDWNKDEEIRLLKQKKLL